MNKIAAAAALAASMTLSTTASAVVIDMDWSGLFTMGSPGGSVLSNSSSSYDFGISTQITGTMSFDTDTGAGTGTVADFLFSGTNAHAHDITMQAIGDGNGGPGSLVLGSMLFDYGDAATGTLNIPVYLVADASGIFGAIQGGVGVGDVITGGVLSSTQAEIEKTSLWPTGLVAGITNPVPFAMTTLDPCQDAAGVLCNSGTPSAGFPLADDGISGTPMATAPFGGHNANFDITSLTVTSVVPVPAAVWLFGSGLIGLVGVARRRKAA